ncbi:tetratricopeptide repeat protein [Pseudohongiella acticola]|jgi:Sel1 repeat|uniref:tetratricopeptide repeat protein n=1 Tax=Pseudohongiella acticola TaxID=1524254 RepID=UPI0030EC487D
MKNLIFLSFTLIISSNLFAQSEIEDLVNKAENGDILAIRNLGEVYYEGSILPQHYGRAFEWYSKAAALGDAHSQFKLADMYFKGESVGKNFGLAYVWYSMADLQNFQPAWMDLISAELMRNICAVELKNNDDNSLDVAQDAASKCYESRYQNCSL